jgi:hypothetical protein
MYAATQNSCDGGICWLQLVLSRFWGLMHEADRPWHRPLIIALCLRGHPTSRRLYQALKPSTLQRIIARRAQVLEQALNLMSQAYMVGALH